MSIASEITRLQNAKADIKTAIEAKGVTVPSSAKIDTYNTYVASIPAGGSSKLPEVVDGSVTSLSASDLGSITSISDYAFYNQTNLSSVTLPNTLTTIGKSSFYGCTSLTSITIPSSVTSVGVGAGSSNDGLFSNSGLTSITIPNSVTSMGARAFYNCTSLTSVIMSNSNVTSLETYVFGSCANLVSLSLPATLTSIKSDAFRNTNSLTAIDFAGTMAQWNAITKQSNWNRGWSVTVIHCSDGDITL